METYNKNEIKEDDLISAVLVFPQENYISYLGIDLPFNKEEGTEEIRLESDVNIEKELIKKDLKENLNTDCQFILGIIINSPERLETPKTGNITIRSITLFLNKNKWNRIRINRAFKEIKNYVKNL
jgi:hypothetical protein